MVEIGGKPILWHIMKIYAAHGIHDFIICLGYKGYVIKEYFANYASTPRTSRSTSAAAGCEVHRSETEPWRVTLVDTGEQHPDRGPAAGACCHTSATRISASPTATAWPTSTSPR